MAGNIHNFLALAFKSSKYGFDLCQFSAYSTFKSCASRIEGRLLQHAKPMEFTIRNIL